MDVPTYPQLVVKNLFEPSSGSCQVTNSNLLEEDGVTEAKYEADYPYNELMMERLMLESPINLDIIFVISLIREETPELSASGPVCYNYVIGVQPVTINKYNLDGTVKVNGLVLNQAAVDEVKRVIRENPYGSLRSVRGREERVSRLGNDLIFGDVVEVLYKQYPTTY